jgi:hypothetical protein
VESVGGNLIRIINYFIRRHEKLLISYQIYKHSNPEQAATVELIQEKIEREKISFAGSFKIIFLDP